MGCHADSYQTKPSQAVLTAKMCSIRDHCIHMVYFVSYIQIPSLLYLYRAHTVTTNKKGRKENWDLLFFFSPGK